jgi:cytochrome c oxidase subunit III
METVKKVRENIPIRASNMFTGIILFLVSELFLFGTLFWTYYYLKFNTNPWPPAGVNPDITLAAINTVFLLASSVTFWWASRQIRKGSERRLAAGLIATAALGAIFLGITVYEWFHESFQPWSHAYGSIFFTLTGFHALHVLGGILLMLALVARTFRHRFSAQKYLAIEISSFYWHFVDFIWIIVFTSLFVVR